MVTLFKMHSQKKKKIVEFILSRVSPNKRRYTKKHESEGGRRRGSSNNIATPCVLTCPANPSRLSFFSLLFSFFEKKENRFFKSNVMCVYRRVGILCNVPLQ